MEAYLEAFYHREILASGACMEYDSAIRWKSGQGNLPRDLLLALLHEFPEQLMLGMDAARSSYWTEYGRRRLPHRASQERPQHGHPAQPRHRPLQPAPR